MSKNYLTISGPNMLQLHGFCEISNYIYVEIFEEKKHILLLTKKRPLKIGCFEVVVSNDRIVNSPILYEYVIKFDLINKRFWEDTTFKHYVSTDIDV